MAFNWPTEELTVSGRVGIGTDTPSKELEVIGDISVTNLNLNGSLTVNQNLNVSGNFQLGRVSINEFSSDGNLADNSNLAIPTEHAVKTYVDHQISQVNNTLNTKADLNGTTNQDFATKNLSVMGNLRISGRLEVQGNIIARDTEHIEGNVSLGDQDIDEVKITGVLRSGHSSGMLRVDDGLYTTGSLTVEGNVGIGTTSIHNPQGWNKVLDILGSSHARLNVRATGGVVTSVFSHDNWNGSRGVIGTESDHPLSLATNYKHQMTIDTEGNVGIGTTNPGAKLEVSGDIKAGGKLSSQNGRVRRDFVTWNTTEGRSDPIHIKTNIKKHSNIMYRILVEGYSYGVGAAINSDIVGYTYHQWDNIGKAQANNYANGISISQYYSSDGYVVIKLTTDNTYYIGFSASAWFTNPNGNSFDISAIVHHQANDL